MAAFYPEYPTPAALAYRQGFLEGAAKYRHAVSVNIPEQMLSRAITRAIAARITAHQAGWVFARVFLSVMGRREMRNGDILLPEAYLLAAFEKEISNK